MAKKVLCYILTFGLILSTILAIITAILSNSILKKDYILSKLEEEHYYERTKAEIEDGFKDYILQSGLDESVITDLFEINKIKQDVNQLVDAIYNNKTINIDTNPIREKLESNIDKVIEEQNKRVDKEEREALDIFVDTIVDTYYDGIVYSKSSAESIGKVLGTGIKILNKVQIIFYMIPIIILLIILFVNLKKPKEILKYIGITLLSTGLLMLLPKIITHIAMDIQNILLLNQTVSNLIQNIITEIIRQFMIIGIIFSIIGIMSIIIGNIIREKE